MRPGEPVGVLVDFVEAPLKIEHLYHRPVWFASSGRSASMSVRRSRSAGASLSDSQSTRHAVRGDELAAMVGFTVCDDPVPGAGLRGEVVIPGGPPHHAVDTRFQCGVRRVDWLGTAPSRHGVTLAMR